MKKKIAMLFTVILMVALVAVCGCGTDEAPQQITVFNYGMYIDPELLDQFTAETGIEVLYEEAVTPEELYSKYSSGAIEYDVVCSSEYIIMKLMEDEALQPIDFSQLEDIDNISQECWDFCATFDEGNQYALPYFYGTVGLLYNKEMVSEPPTSWDVLFNGEYAGNIIMQNSMRDSFMVALCHLGYSCNTTNPEELAEARDLLIAQKADVQAYLVDEARDEMVAENAAIAVVYSGDGILGCEYNENLAYVVPSEGSNLWIDCWAMTKECDNQEAVYEFLNFLCCRQDVALQNFEYVYYPTPNTAVIEALDEEIRNNETIIPNLESLTNCEVYQLMDEETTNLMSEYWKEVKAE